MGTDKNSLILDISKRTSIVQFIVMIILFIVALIMFVRLYKTQNDEIKDTLQATFNNSQTNFMQIVIENNNANTNANKVYINREEFYASINKAFENHYILVKDSVESIVRNQTSMLSFWFSFLSIVMVVFTILGLFINNRILENTEKQAKDVLNRLNNDYDRTKKELDDKYTESFNSLKKDVELSIKKAEDIEKLMASIDSEVVNIKNNNNKEKVEKLFKEAFDLAERNDIENSIELYTQVLGLNDKYSEAYNNRGILYYKKYKYSEIEDYSDKAISDYDNALFYYKKSNADKKKMAKTNYNMGLLYHTMYRIKRDNGDYEKSKNYYNEALALNCDYVSAKNGIRILEDLKKRFDKEKGEEQEGNNNPQK